MECAQQISGIWEGVLLDIEGRRSVKPLMGFPKIITRDGERIIKVFVLIWDLW